MSALRSCNVSTTWSVGQPSMCDLALLEESRDDARHATPGREGGIGDDAHQADLAAAGDDLDRAGGELTAERGRRLGVDRVMTR